MNFLIPESSEQLLTHRGIYITPHSITTHPRKTKVKGSEIESYFCRLQAYLRDALLPGEFEHVKVFCNGDKWELVHRQNVILIMCRRSFFNTWKSPNTVNQSA